MASSAVLGWSSRFSTPSSPFSTVRSWYLAGAGGGATPFPQEQDPMTGKTQDTLAAFKAAQKSPIDDPAFAGLLAKSSTFSEGGSPTSGLTFFDLEAGAKLL